MIPLCFRDKFSGPSAITIVIAVMAIPAIDAERVEDKAFSAGTTPRNTRNMVPAPSTKANMKNDTIGYLWIIHNRSLFSLFIFLLPGCPLLLRYCLSPVLYILVSIALRYYHRLYVMVGKIIYRETIHPRRSMNQATNLRTPTNPLAWRTISHTGASICHPLVCGYRNTNTQIQ